MIFFSEAFAQSVETVNDAGQNPLISFIPLIAIFVVFYFLLIRPQQKKIKEHKSLVGSLKKGDAVVANGFIGIVNRIVKDSDIIYVEIVKGVIVQMSRYSISEVITDRKVKLEFLPKDRNNHKNDNNTQKNYNKNSRKDTKKLASKEEESDKDLLIEEKEE